MKISSLILSTGLVVVVGHMANAANLGRTSPVMTGLLSGDSIRATPAQYVDPYEARRRENALYLSRSERREIQGNLQILGYNPGPADGVFGDRTRDAISSWQRSAGYWRTGYVTREQINQIARAARDKGPGSETDRRLAEDRSYWTSSGAAGGSIAGMRRYLERYPSGVYAGLARSRIKADEERSADAERDYWIRTGSADGDIAGMRRYLERYPDGVYARLARDRIKADEERRVADDRNYWVRTGGADGNLAGMKRYLERYPRGAYADLARSRIKKHEDRLTEDDRRFWILTGAVDGDVSGMRRYLERYPEGTYAAVARNRIRAYERELSTEEQDLWKDVSRLDTIRAYRYYLDRHPRGRYASQAKARIRELQTPPIDVQPDDLVAWSEARNADTIAGYKRYIRDYPGSRHAADAQARLEVLRASESANAEQNLWKEVDRADRIEGYKNYLNRFPHGRNADAARKRLAELRLPIIMGIGKGDADKKKPFLGTPERITMLQQDLASLGYYNGPITGRMNNETREAVLRFQRDLGVK